MQGLKTICANCVRVGDEIYSYETNVATVKDNKLIELGKWSVTTSKHVKRAANEFNLELVKFETKTRQ
jgi:hypothetical protein